MGRGKDLIEEWQYNRPTRASCYNDMANDLAEGANIYFDSHKDVDDSVIKLYKKGSLSVIFELQNDEILKISLENPLEFREHNSNFDIPFLTPVEKYGKTYTVKQPKADTENITREHFLDVKKRIRYGLCELSADGRKYEQYGLYNGKPYLLDTRCAMPMPNAWTLLIDEICSRLNKCCTILSPEQYDLKQELKFKEKGYFAYHCDETPRKSVTFKEGLLKLFNTIKNNVKYRKILLNFL